VEALNLVPWLFRYVFEIEKEWAVVRASLPICYLGWSELAGDDDDISV
jgi:hypothetical protein